MSLVEEAYRARVDALSPVEKMRRLEELLHWTRELIARQVKFEKGDISDEQVKREVCLRMYGGDPRFRKLLEEDERDVSG